MFFPFSFFALYFLAKGTALLPGLAYILHIYWNTFYNAFGGSVWTNALVNQSITCCLYSSSSHRATLCTDAALFDL